MRFGVVAIVGVAVVVGAACSGSPDTDETRAEAGAERVLESEVAGPTSVSDGDDAAGSADRSSGSDGTEQPDDTDDTSVDAGRTAELEDTEPGDADDSDENADTDTDQPDSDDPDDAAQDGSADDGTTDDDTTDDETIEENADEERAGPDSGRDLTGPGSASAASARTLVPVEQGDSGEDVLALQARLAELGFAPGNPDGSYGRRTVAAIEAFQGLVDLDQTGTADAATITALVTYRYDGLTLRAGDEGGDVETLQLKLSEGPFDPGPADGAYGTGTVQAVWALEKLAGIPVDGDWGPLDEKAWQQLVDGKIGRPEKSHDERWVEVDLSQQIMKVYDPDSTTPTLISHASSGSGIPWKNEDHSGSSITPVGDFQINRRISGWRESSLNIGRLYNPLYFNGGIAFHGASSVPLYPASHGCIRLPMHVADYLPSELPNGTPVHVLK
ncbi:MAG: L,D-transpeptidase family protein [Acidimicrobiales bacterium]